MYTSLSLSLYIYIYIYIYIAFCRRSGPGVPTQGGNAALIRPVHLLRVSLLRVLESNFPGDPLYNHMDMRIPTP